MRVGWCQGFLGADPVDPGGIAHKSLPCWLHFSEEVSVHLLYTVHEWDPSMKGLSTCRVKTQLDAGRRGLVWTGYVHPWQQIMPMNVLTKLQVQGCVRVCLRAHVRE